MIALSQLPAGSEVVLCRIGGERSFRRRLMEMGLLPGTAVRVVRRVDVGGLVQLEVRGCQLRSGRPRNSTMRERQLVVPPSAMYTPPVR